MDLSERVAVIESELAHAVKGLDNLTRIIEHHMESEERDRKLLMKQLQDLSSAQTKMKSFWGGVVFAASAIWTVILALFYILWGKN